MGMQVGIQVPISSSSSDTCEGKGSLALMTVSGDHKYCDKLRHCLEKKSLTSIRKKLLQHFCENTGHLVFKYSLFS